MWSEENCFGPKRGDVYFLNSGYFLVVGTRDTLRRMKVDGTCQYSKHPSYLISSKTSMPFSRSPIWLMWVKDFLHFRTTRRWPLYCFYFHQKCPGRPEQRLYICIYVYMYVYMSTAWWTLNRYKNLLAISVKFVCLFLISSAKSLLDQKSSSKCKFSQ